MKKHWILTAALSLFVLASAHLVTVALGDTPNPVPSRVVALQGGAQPASTGDLLAATGDLIHSWGGLVWQLKIAGIIMLLIASMKVSIVDKYVWDRLGQVQRFAGPILGLLVGFFTLAASHMLSLAGLLAYLSAGAGALLLHELLDGVKGWPGIGPAYVAVVNAIEGALGGNPVGAQDKANAMTDDQQKPSNQG